MTFISVSSSIYTVKCDWCWFINTHASIHIHTRVLTRRIKEKNVQLKFIIIELFCTTFISSIKHQLINNFKIVFKFISYFIGSARLPLFISFNRLFCTVTNNCTLAIVMIYQSYVARSKSYKKKEIISNNFLIITINQIEIELIFSTWTIFFFRKYSETDSLGHNLIN